MSAMVAGRSVNVVPLIIFAEGRVKTIDLDPSAADEIKLLNEADSTSPVVLRFSEAETHYYVNFFDHRASCVRAFRDEEKEAYLKTFGEVPCLASCRKKTGLYFVLADIGTPDIADGGPAQSLLLTRLSILDKMSYRVCRGERRDALHPATGICLAEPRPPKAE